jgi:cyclopropane-fatty-acyl-phospholipid synthase
MFQTFLDPTMTYSCAVFEKESDSLEQAQYNKIHKIIREANINANDHVLEIGSGWGAFAMEAVRKTGCRVTTVTISEEQYAEAKKRIEDAGLQDRINILLMDYRKIEGKFDKVVSVEMIEAVGHEYFPQYFSVRVSVLSTEPLLSLLLLTFSLNLFPDHRQAPQARRCRSYPGYHVPRCPL